MKQKGKRVLSLILALVFVLSLSPVSYANGSAEAAQETEAAAQESAGSSEQPQGDGAPAENAQATPESVAGDAGKEGQAEQPAAPQTPAGDGNTEAGSLSASESKGETQKTETVAAAASAETGGSSEKDSTAETVKTEPPDGKTEPDTPVGTETPEAAGDKAVESTDQADEKTDGTLLPDVEKADVQKTVSAKSATSAGRNASSALQGTAVPQSVPVVPAAAGSSTGDFTVTGSGYTYNSEEHVLLVESGADITVSGETTTDRIEVQEGAKLTLESVKIAISENPAVKLLNNLVESIKKVIITITGNSSLEGSYGIQVPGGTEVEIVGASGKEGNDSLTAVGIGYPEKEGKERKNGSGIGYSEKEATNAGNILIHDIQKVEARSTIRDPSTDTPEKDSFAKKGEGGVGIGGGRVNEAAGVEEGIVILRDIGEVYAEGGDKGTGIGAHYWKGARIEIENVDKLIAIGGKSAAGIGASRDTAYYEKDPTVTKDALDTFISIVDSNVYAEGGYYAAGIGGGFNNDSVGNEANNTGYPYLPGITISIDGKSEVEAVGGNRAAGIGGGYKLPSANITIGSEATVYAFAGETKTNGKTEGKYLPEAIGAGGEGSGIYSNSGTSIIIKEGADVYAYGYGYDVVGSPEGIMYSKWPVNHEAETDQTNASIIVLRFLNDGLKAGNQDFYKEKAKEGDDAPGTMKFLEKESENEIKFVSLTSGTAYTAILPVGYTSLAVDLPQDTYQLLINGEAWSFLPDEACWATTDGSTTNNGIKKNVYGMETVDQTGEYAKYEKTLSWGDHFTIHNSFGKPSANFAVGTGVNFFDAVAYRGNIEPEPVPTPEPEPTPTPNTGPVVPFFPAEELEEDDVPLALGSLSNQLGECFD